MIRGARRACGQPREPGRAAGARAGRRILVGALLLTVAAVTVAAAEQGNALVLGDLRIPPPAGYINDHAGLLPAEQRAELEQICRGIDQRTGTQIALVILPDLKGEEAGDVKTRLFETWRVGRAADDRGLLMLHALEERRIEVEVGYGLEPILPDARVGRILDEYVMPHFRENRFFEGYRAGLLAIGQVVAGDPDAGGGADAYGTGARPGARGRFPLGALIIIPVFLYLLVRHPRLLLLMMVMGMGGGRGGGGTQGGFGGGFGGFGGGMSGGGGAGRSY